MNPKLRHLLLIIAISSTSVFLFSPNLHADESNPRRIESARAFFANIPSEIRNLSNEESLTATDAALEENYKLDLSAKPGINVLLTNGIRTRFLPSSSLYAQGNVLCRDASSCPSSSIDFQGIFTPCLQEVQSDCISRFGYITETGSVEDFIPETRIDHQYASQATDNGNKTPVANYYPNVALGTTAGGTPYVWRSPSLKHKFGNLYIPQVVYTNQSWGTSSTLNFLNKGFDISVYPVRLVKPERITTQEGLMQPNYNIVPSSYLNIPKFILEFRSTIPWTGWAKSTISDLQVDLSRSGKDYIYTIKGAPLKTQIVQKNLSFGEVNPTILKKLVFPGSSLDKQCPDGLVKCSLYVTNMKTAYDGIFPNLTLLESSLGSTANAYPYKWSIGSLFAFDYYSKTGIVGSNKITACLANFKNTLAGITTTNSVVTSEGPPTWNSKNLSLDYQLFSVSKDKQGDTFKGTYSLQISNEVALCLWGTKPTLSNAKLEVTNSDGNVQIVTSTTKINKAGLAIQVSGFHFSSPVIRVKLVKK